MDAVHEDEGIIQGSTDVTATPLLPAGSWSRDFADHFSRKFDPIKFLELIMNIPCAHSAGIERDHLFFNAGNIPLIFRNQLWFKLTIAVTRNIDLKLPVLAFECFARMTVPFIVAFRSPLQFFS